MMIFLGENQGGLSMRLGFALLALVGVFLTTAWASSSVNDELSAQSRIGGGYSVGGDIVCPQGTVRAGKRVRQLAACDRPRAGAQPQGNVPKKGRP
jgi:hypothetical protein